MGSEMCIRDRDYSAFVCVENVVVRSGASISRNNLAIVIARACHARKVTALLDYVLSELAQRTSFRCIDDL